MRQLKQKMNIATRHRICLALTPLMMATTAIGADQSMTTGERQIKAETTVPAKRSEVWNALTTTDGATTFFAPAAHIELRADGPYEIYFLPDSEAGTRGAEGCRVQAFVPERMLAITWNAPMKFLELRGKRTFVVFELEDTPEGHTKVTLTNGGYQSGEAWDATHAYFSNAWPRVLANLKRRFESGPLFTNGDRKNITRAKRSTYVYLLHPTRPEMETSPTPEEIKAVGDHWQYLLKLMAKDQLILAGRTGLPTQFPDTSGGMVSFEMPDIGIVMFEAEDAAQAKHIMENDPAVARGVFKARVQPYGLALLRP